MAIFKRKGKPTKTVEAIPKKEAAAGQAPMKAYKPKHMSDAALHGSRNAHQDARNSVHSQQFYSHPKANSEEIIPQSQPPSMSGSRYDQVSRQHSEYLYQPRGRSGGYDNTMPFARGRGKADLGKEPSHMTPFYSSDSGYESAGPQSATHSRVPSVQNLQDPRQLYNNRASHSFIPELRLGQEPLEQMSGIEHVLTGDTATKSQEGVLKTVGDVPPLKLEYDANSEKSNKSTNKKARFEHQPEPMPALDQLQHRREIVSMPPASKLPGQVNMEIPKQQMTTAHDAAELALHEQGQKSQGTTQFLQLPPGTFETLQLAHPSDGSAHNEGALRRAVQHTHPMVSSRRPIVPPLSILEGLKVNKKGNILDEEGDPVGELVDGDLLDCVRQKANAQGEVLNEYGRVVGTVRTIPSIGDTPARLELQPEVTTQLLQASQPSLDLHTGGGPDARQTSLQDTEAHPTNFSQHKSPAHDPQEHTPLAPHQVTAQQQDVNGDSHAHRTPAVRHIQDDQDDQDEDQSTAPLDDLSSQAPATVHSDESQYATSSAPKEPQDQGPQEYLRSSRSASERSLSELGRSYARPPMDPVPEDNVPEDDIKPVESSDLFAYKGEIPLTDARSSSRPLIDPSFPRSALSGGHPGSSMFPQGMPGQFSPSARIPFASRRATTHFTGDFSSINLNPKLAMRNDTRGHESSPKRSENGTDSISDDIPTIRLPHIRTPSMRSNATTVEKPRTYFTHGGKITVDANTAMPEEVVPKAAEPVVENVVHKKRSRFSIGFGKKK